MEQLSVKYLFVSKITIEVIDDARNQSRSN